MNFSFPEPDVAALLGSEYTTGRHVFIHKRRSGGYHFAGIVGGKMQCYASGSDPDDALAQFARQFGPYDSVHRFDSLEEAHAAFPKFYMNPETAGDTWS